MDIVSDAIEQLHEEPGVEGKTTRPAEPAPALAPVSTPRISYAQQGEDVLLDRLFAGLDPPGTYLSIGAFHPVTDSDTRWFYERGWRGVNIEPIPDRAAVFEAERPGDLNLCCAVGADDGEAVLYVVGDMPGLSTLDAELAEGYHKAGKTIEARAVPVRALGGPDGLVAEHSIPPPDFLSIDCEGLETAVLIGAAPLFASGWLPRALVIESTAPLTASPTFRRWEYLIDRWYGFAATTGVNRIYLRRDLYSDPAVRRRLSYPVCALDQFVRHDLSWVRWRLLEVQRLLAEVERFARDA